MAALSERVAACVLLIPRLWRSAPGSLLQMRLPLRKSAAQRKAMQLPRRALQGRLRYCLHSSQKQRTSWLWQLEMTCRCDTSTSFLSLMQRVHLTKTQPALDVTRFTP